MRRLGSILVGVALFVSSCSPVVFDEESTPKGEVLITLKQDDKTTATKATENLPEVGEFIVEVTETSSNRLFFRKKYYRRTCKRISSDL